MQKMPLISYAETTKELCALLSRIRIMPTKEIQQMSKISQAKIKVLDNFERRNDEWSHGEFEQELEKSMGKLYKNYQDAKMTIIEAHRNGCWPKTVKGYLISNNASLGNLPVELIPIAQEIGLFEKT